MLRSGNVLGGEQSGHVIFLDDSPAGDGLLTAVKIASLVSMHGRLESLVEGLKDYPQVIVNVKVHSKPPMETLPEVARALAEAESALGGQWPHRSSLFRYRTPRSRHGRSRASGRCATFQSIRRGRSTLLDRRLIPSTRCEVCVHRKGRPPENGLSGPTPGTFPAVATLPYRKTNKD